MKIQIYSCNASAILLKAKMDVRVVQKIFIIVQKIVEFLYLQNFSVFFLQYYIFKAIFKLSKGI